MSALLSTTNYFTHSKQLYLPAKHMTGSGRSDIDHETYKPRGKDSLYTSRWRSNTMPCANEDTNSSYQSFEKTAIENESSAFLSTPRPIVRHTDEKMKSKEEKYQTKNSNSLTREETKQSKTTLLNQQAVNTLCDYSTTSILIHSQRKQTDTQRSKSKSAEDCDISGYWETSTSGCNNLFSSIDDNDKIFRLPNYTKSSGDPNLSPSRSPCVSTAGKPMASSAQLSQDSKPASITSSGPSPFRFCHVNGVISESAAPIADRREHQAGNTHQNDSMKDNGAAGRDDQKEFSQNCSSPVDYSRHSSSASDAPYKMSTPRGFGCSDTTNDTASCQIKMEDDACVISNQQYPDMTPNAFYLKAQEGTKTTRRYSASDLQWQENASHDTVDRSKSAGSWFDSKITRNEKSHEPDVEGSGNGRETTEGLATLSAGLPAQAFDSVAPGNCRDISGNVDTRQESAEQPSAVKLTTPASSETSGIKDSWEFHFDQNRFSVNQAEFVRGNDPRVSMSESYGFCSSSSPTATWSRDYDPLFCQANGQNCVVCGELANGNFFGAVVCLPCKSFFIRCTKDGEPCIIQQCGGNCDITKQLRNRCQYCRYQRCLVVGMSRKEKPECVQPQEGQELCKVCGDLANGIHFGVYTCEGCKKFFRRGLKEHLSYVCKDEKHCRLNPRNRNNCRFCRYQKCLAVGMSREAIKMGRPRKLYPSRTMNGLMSSMEMPMTMFSPYSRDRINTSPAYDSKEHIITASQTDLPREYRPPENYRTVDSGVWYNKAEEQQNPTLGHVRKPPTSVEISNHQNTLLPQGNFQHRDNRQPNSFTGISGHISKNNQSIKDPTDLRPGSFHASLCHQPPLIHSSALQTSRNHPSVRGIQTTGPQNGFEAFQQRALETTNILSDAQLRCPEQLSNSLTNKSHPIPNGARQQPCLSVSKCSNNDYLLCNRNNVKEYIKGSYGQAVIPQSRTAAQPSNLIRPGNVPPPLIMHPSMNSQDIMLQSRASGIQKSRTFPHQSPLPPLMQMASSVSTCEVQRISNHKETDMLNSPFCTPPQIQTGDMVKVTESSHRPAVESCNRTRPIPGPFENKYEPLALDLTVKTKPPLPRRIYSFPNNLPESYFKMEPQSLKTESQQVSWKRKLELTQTTDTITVEPDHTVSKVLKIEENDQTTALSTSEYHYSSQEESLNRLDQHRVNNMTSMDAVPKVRNCSTPPHIYSSNNRTNAIIHRSLTLNTSETGNKARQFPFIKQEIPELWENENSRNPNVILPHSFDSQTLAHGRQKLEQAEHFTPSSNHSSLSKLLSSKPCNSFPVTNHDFTSPQAPISWDSRHQCGENPQSSPSSCSVKGFPLSETPVTAPSRPTSLPSEAGRVSLLAKGTKKIPVSKVEDRCDGPTRTHEEKQVKKAFDPYTNQHTLIYINEMFQMVETLTDSVRFDTDREPREKISAVLEALDGMFCKVNDYSPLQVTQFWQSLYSSDIYKDLDKEKSFATSDPFSWLDDITKGYINQVIVCDEDTNPPFVDMNNHEVWPPRGEDANHWKHFQERVARQTYAEAQFLLLLPDIDKIHPKDRVKLGNNTRLFGNTILMASREWFDPVRKKFKFFWNWKLASDNPLSPFRNSIIKTGSRIFNLHMDQKEVAILSALNIMSSENGTFHNLEQVNGHTQSLLKVLCCYLRSINVDPDDRIPELLSVMPKIRHLSMWYSNLIRNMRVDPSSMDKTLQDLTVIASKSTFGERIKHQRLSDKGKLPCD